MTWRDGVHLAGTPIWCDARRRRDICFLSSVDRAGRSGHGQLIATAPTIALLGARDQGHLAVPLRQRFTLGTVRLELIPSGRGLGAAALFADVTGRTVLYAGAVRPAAGGAGDPAELRTCDAVVVAAPYGAPHHRFPALATVIDAVLTWTRAQLAADRRPALLVDSVLDGLEVAARLAAEGFAVAGGRPLRDAAQRVPDLVPAIAAPGREARAIVWLAGDRGGLARSLGDRAVATALLSARVATGDTGMTDDVAGFAWAGAADRAQLLGWIEATGARDVYVTGACAEEIARALGPRARVIGPPQQMSLFPDEAPR